MPCKARKSLHGLSASPPARLPGANLRIAIRAPFPLDLNGGPVKILALEISGALGINFVNRSRFPGRRA
jgi:hypothetical protein